MKYLYIVCILFIFSCGDKTTKTSVNLNLKDMDLKDTSTVVTEYDTAHLRNIVKDISKPMSDQKMIKQVIERKDSVEALVDSMKNNVE